MKTLSKLLFRPMLFLMAGCLLLCQGCSCRPEAFQSAASAEGQSQQQSQANSTGTTAGEEHSEEQLEAQDGVTDTETSAKSQESTEASSQAAGKGNSQTASNGQSQISGEGKSTSAASSSMLAPSPAPNALAGTETNNRAETGADTMSDAADPGETAVQGSRLSGEANSDGANSDELKPSATPGQALQAAERLAMRGKQALTAGDAAAAYQFTLQAWQQLQPHKGDAACQQQSQQLEAQLEAIGEQINASFRTPNGTPRRDKPVTIR